MRGITQYILRQIAWPLLFATLTLAGVIWLTQSLRFIDRIVNNNLGFGSFFYLTMLVLPNVTGIILPIAAFCATLYAYNRLASDSELVVLSASGFSRYSLARPAMLVAILVMTALYAIGLYIGPLSSRTLRATQFEFRSSLASMVILEGVFNTPSPNLTVYVREREPSGEMKGILVHDSRDANRPVTMMAARAALVLTQQGPRLLMVDGNRQQVEPGRRGLSILYFNEYALDLNLYIKPETEGWREPQERFLSELFYPDMNNLDDVNNRNKLLVEGHRRLVSPLYVPALMLIAIAGVIGGEFNRRGQGRRLISAAGAGIVLQVLSLGVAQIATRTPTLIVAMYAVPLLAMLIALWLLREPNRQIAPHGGLAALGGAE
ncbi:LPS export ABC transporter permease LptF [Ferrovibrio sp.]|uniref:LPS export ABC transporter permease LptF n=1 Tax=Ferrovibrio sp. TaxID=1917215 RepID=UPI0025C1D2A2|nr:LPS export ABC transporter permease LptF [Ferrovibrio sp.]MBX3456373.1 LPS export ABC transporter permease LptF [Ferrovibrio sp.]